MSKHSQPASTYRAPAAHSPVPPTSTDKSKPIAAKNTLEVLRHLAPFLAPYKSKAIAAIVFLLIAAAATLVTPIVLRNVVDLGFTPAIKNKDISSLTTTLIWFAIVGAVMAFAAGARFTVVSWIGERVVSDMRSKVFASLLKQPPVFFETVSTGEVLSRLTADTTLIQTLVGSSLSMGLRNAILLVGSLVMLFVTNVKVTALVVGMIAVVMGIIFVFTRRVRRLSRASQDRVADVSSLASEVLNAMTTVQAHTQEANELKKFESRVEDAFNTGMRRTRIRAIAMVVIMLAFTLALLYGVWLGGQFVLEGKATIGELSQYAVYALMVGSSASVVAEVWGDLQRAAGASERLLELLNTEPAIKNIANITAANPFAIHASASVQGKAAATSAISSNLSSQMVSQLSIEFSQVDFAYPSRAEKNVLNQFNLKIPAGQRVALVGTSGAGKSTLFSLLQRFHEPQNGQIELQRGSVHVPINQLQLQDLRNLISVVSQEPVIFSASAFDNIRYGKPNASLEEVRQAAKTAAIDDFIGSLPEGYDTFMGERGVRLSGGQRQRLAIARAVLRDSPILLLDEATSALDAENEHLVQEALEKAMQGRTCLVIAHRLATIRDCDIIHVMNQGKIVESGKHDELLAQGKTYARLVELQSLAA
jgi:ATP-binding cassette, subfamily B, bacterial